MIRAAAAEKFRETMARREQLLTAWVAETGLLPSESVMYEQYDVRDGVAVLKVWVERK